MSRVIDNLGGARDGCWAVFDLKPAQAGTGEVMKDKLALIGVEWSGSLIRAWAFDDEGETLGAHHVREDCVPGRWAERLTFQLAEWLGSAPVVPVIACGAPGGPGQSAGAELLTSPIPIVHLSGHISEHHGIHVVPWVSQGSPPDLTCGAETVLFGLGDANGSICIVGQHTRHCRTEHGRLTGFTTEITAEWRDLLLSHGTLALDARDAQAFDMAVFRDWLERAIDAGSPLGVFSVEAAMRQGALSPANKAAALAGLMIGSDVAAHYDPGEEVLLVADGPLLEAYGLALDLLGADVEETSAAEAVQEGLFEIADLAGLLGED